jgi:hypothetical protein
MGVTMKTYEDDIDVLAKPATAPDKKYVIPENAAVLAPMASFCECELAVNEDGVAVVIYTKPMPEGIQWVEYDMDLSLLTFVSWSGTTMELGMKVHPPFRKYLKMAKEIMMIELKDNKENIASMYPAKLMVRNIGI